MIGIDADDGVEGLRRKRQRRGVRLDGQNLRVGQAHLGEEAPVVLRVAPQVRGIDRKAVFPGQKHARQPLAAAQVADQASLRDAVAGQQLLLELEGIGAHDLFHEFRRAVLFTQRVFHRSNLLDRCLLIFEISLNFCSLAAR